MSYLKNSLSSKEKLIKEFPIHPFLYFNVIILVFLSIASAYMLISFKDNPLVIKYISEYFIYLYSIPVVLLLLSLWQIIVLKHIEYGLTDRKIIAKLTVFNRNTDEILNKSVESVKLTQTLPGRIFKYGTLEITGRGNEVVILRDIKSPLIAKKIIEENVFS